VSRAVQVALGGSPRHGIVVQATRQQLVDPDAAMLALGHAGHHEIGRCPERSARRAGHTSHLGGVAVRAIGSSVLDDV
jgi:hypothetical protein